MNAVEKIQAEGPKDKSPEEQEKWYDRILEAARALHPNLVSGVSIKGELDEEQAETVGNYNPITGKFEGGRHEKLFDVTEEL
jgi:hypothetical protein